MLLQRVKLDLCSRERWAVLCLFLDVTNGAEIKQALIEQRILNATVLNASCVSTLLKLPPIAYHQHDVVGESISRDVCSE